jgi:predicted nuclease of predicted toxin-antitoxin system
MKFLLDHDVYAITARFLRDLDPHDVVVAGEVGYARATDAELLNIAQKQARILVTRDRDFGGLVFVKRAGSGVIYLRLMPSTTNIVHHELGEVLQSYSEAELQQAFVVVEPGRHRFRKLPE